MFSAASPALEDLSAPRSTLALDEHSLDPRELSVPALLRELDLQQRPSWLLRQLMNLLEQKRQAQGLGWSRPWNKTGLTVFRTHRQDPLRDHAYFAPAFALLDQLLPPSAAGREFVDALLADPQRLAFTFYHNRQDGAAQWEGLTISLGRKVTGDATKRDRLDLILEDRRHEGRVDGVVDLLRVYVCPWTGYRDGRQHQLIEVGEFSPGLRRLTQELYQHAIACYHAWKHDEARQWSHWSADYIDYFGARSFIPVGTAFH